jgi:mycofactocin system glycosyltransferase
MSTLPPSFRVALDASTRVTDGGRVLIGGSPLRILRLTAAGGAVVAALAAGEAVGESSARQRLARRLLDTGVAHPRPSSSPFSIEDLTIVVPTHGGPPELERTLRALRTDAPEVRIIVVDDASPAAEAEELAATARAHHAELVVRPANGGPGAARNTGLALVTTPVVAFVDRDVEPEPGWLEPLLAHLADPAVALVAPRVQATPAGGVLAQFEARRSPLDLGAAEARVASGSRVSYIPSATVVARTGVLVAAGGFDERLRVGEDVDLVWRLDEQGHTVRYEPASVVRHPARTTLPAWVRQRFGYGESAALLDERHPGAVPPISMSGWTLAAWGLAAAGHPVLGAGVAATTTALLPAKLGALEHPWQESFRLAGSGHARAWEPLAAALTRTWWPATAAAALVSKRARRAAVAAVVVPAVLEWSRGDRAVDPVRYTALRALDDAAYGAGVWAGCVRARRWGPLTPALRSWPGRRSPT